jgi:acetylornithine/succinyldiaminopimelate/putrescine aminotransferase
VGSQISKLIEDRIADAPRLHAEHLNHQQPRVLHTIGMERRYVRAKGAYLYDDAGEEYLDFLSGFGVFGIGRNHPAVQAALTDVINADLADLVKFDTPVLPGLLAERLLGKAPWLERVFFCNGGSDAVESALKFARRATGRPRVLYLDHAFHGLTTGSLSVNGSEEFRKGFGPLLPDTCIQIGDIDALERELRKGDVAALLVEPIQGKTVQEMPDGFLAAAHRMLTERKAMLICDEVQSGLGRTGTFFAFEHDGVEPDMITVSKSLSGGFAPVGAVLARKGIFEKVYSSMDQLMVHSTTFTGNALAMVAGLTTLDVIEEEQLTERSARMGTLMHDRLTEMIDEFEFLSGVRGRGLMIGIDFGKPKSLRLRSRWSMLQTARHGLFAQMVVMSLFQRHRILTQVAGDHMETIKLLPPLVIGEKEVEAFTEAMRDVLTDAQKGGLMWEFGRTLVRQALR